MFLISLIHQHKNEEESLVGVAIISSNSKTGVRGHWDHSKNACLAGAKIFVILQIFDTVFACFGSFFLMNSYQVNRLLFFKISRPCNNTFL